MTSQQDLELVAMKSIPVDEYAATRGWELDRRRSTSRARVMRSPSGDRIVCGSSANHQTYFDVRNGSGGSVLDFCVNFCGAATRGHARRMLRAYTGGAPEGPQVPSPKKRSAHSEPDLDASWQALTQLNHAGRTYLIDRRALPAELVDAVARDDAVRSNAAAVCFPHTINICVCGWEIKNRWPPFCSGGTKALWRWQSGKLAERIIVAESPIDALSYLTIHPGPSLLLSLGGQPGKRSIDLLRHACVLTRVPVLCALDADEAGRSIFDRLRPTLEAAGANVSYDPPASGGAKDWNDALTSTDANSVATARASALRDEA